jgi:hypothetical protein
MAIQVQAQAGGWDDLDLYVTINPIPEVNEGYSKLPSWRKLRRFAATHALKRKRIEATAFRRHG